MLAPLAPILDFLRHLALLVHAGAAGASLYVGDEAGDDMCFRGCDREGR